MTAKKKPAAKADPAPPEATTDAKGMDLNDALLLLRDCQEALHEINKSGNIGSITRWEFARQRAHNRNPQLVTSTIAKLRAALGDYIPRDQGGKPRVGVRYINE